MKKEMESTKLILRLENGLNTAGKMTYKQVIFSRVVDSASDEAVQAVGAALATLQDKALQAVIRLDQQKLSAE